MPDYKKVEQYAYHDCDDGDFSTGDKPKLFSPFVPVDHELCRGS